MPEWLKAILARPTASIPDTGRCFDLGKNTAYGLARSGAWPLVGTKHKQSVPTAFIRDKLGLPPVEVPSAALDRLLSDPPPSKTR
jgi:hypothetical protein